MERVLWCMHTNNPIIYLGKASLDIFKIHRGKKKQAFLLISFVWVQAIVVVSADTCYSL